MFEKIWGRNLNSRTVDAVSYLNKTLLYLGIKPPKKHRRLFYIYMAYTYFHIFCVAQVAFNMANFLDKSLTIKSLLSSFQTSINVLGLPFKLLAVTLSLPRLRFAEKLMAILDKRCTRIEEFSEMRRAAIFGNRVVVAFISLYLFYVIGMFMCSIAMGQPPYMMYVPFVDWHKSQWTFVQQLLAEFLIEFVLLSHQGIYDGYPVVYIYVLRTHMKILAERVRRLGTDANLSSEQHFVELVKCIADHQCILKLFNAVSYIISITLFVQFLISAAILGITIFNLVISADASARIATVLYVIAITLQISPTCYQATCLLNDSEELPMAIYQSNWIEQDKRFRSMLIFFMQRAQQPMLLTAMKIFPISLDTNISIAKFSFSLYTLLTEMDFGQIN